MRAVEMVKHTTGFHVISVSLALDMAQFQRHTHTQTQTDKKYLLTTHLYSPIQINFLLKELLLTLAEKIKNTLLPYTVQRSPDKSKTLRR